MPTLIGRCGGGGGGFVQESYGMFGLNSAMILAPGTHLTVDFFRQNSPGSFYTFPDHHTVETPVAGTADHTYHVLQVGLRNNSTGIPNPVSIRAQIVPTYNGAGRFAMASATDTNNVWVNASSFGFDSSGAVSQTYTAVVYNDDAADEYEVVVCNMQGFRSSYL